jgi:hypothetical protein
MMTAYSIAIAIMALLAVAQVAMRRPGPTQMTKVPLGLV